MLPVILYFWAHRKGIRDRVLEKLMRYLADQPSETASAAIQRLETKEIRIGSDCEASHVSAVISSYLVGGERDIGTLKRYSDVLNDNLDY